MSLLDGPGHYGHSPVPYTILGALKSCGPTTASSSSMVNMGLLGEVKHRNTVIIVCTCVLQCIGVDVYTYRIAMYPMPRPCTLYTNIHSQFIMITYVA